MRIGNRLSRTAVVCVLGLAVGLLPQWSSARPITGSIRFTAADGLHQTWTVPAGVGSATVVVTGAAGGYGGLDCGYYGCTRPAPSRAGQVRATVVLSSGDTVDIYPGRAGSIGRDNSGCNNLGGPGGASGYGLQGGHGGDAGCVGASGGGGGGGAGSAIVVRGIEVIAGGAAGGAGNRNNWPESWQWARDEGPRLDARVGGDGVNPRDVRGTGVDGGGGGGGGGGWSAGAGGTEYTCCGEFGALGGVRGASGWSGVDATESLVSNSGDGYIDISWTGVVPSIASAPRNTQVTATSAYSGRVDWMAPADLGDTVVQSYIVETRPSGSSDWVPTSTVDGGQLFADLMDLPCGLAVDVRVRAVNAAGTSVPSEIVRWQSPPRQFTLCNPYPRAVPAGTTVTIRAAGASAPAGFTGTGAVLFSIGGKPLSAPVDADGIATVSMVPGSRGKTLVTATVRYLALATGKLQTIRASTTVWTPAFTVPKTLVVGQTLRVSGTYISPGAVVTLATADGVMSETASATGSVLLTQQMTTRGDQTIRITSGATVLLAATVKVGGKPSTW